MFEKILAATDGSEQAARAVGIASDIAAKHGASLHIVHVMSEDESLDSLRRFAEIEDIGKEDLATAEATRRVETIEATPHGPVPVPGGRQSQVDARATRQEIGRRLLKQAERLAQERGTESVTCVLLEGKAAEQILECAEEKHADAIVLGSRGLNALQRAIIGSVSHKVCDQADCVCITVT